MLLPTDANRATTCGVLAGPCAKSDIHYKEALQISTGQAIQLRRFGGLNLRGVNPMLNRNGPPSMSVAFYSPPWPVVDSFIVGCDVLSLKRSA